MKNGQQEIKIEKGIPVPETRRTRSPLTQALRNMQPGDSFVYSNNPSTLHAAARLAGVKIVTRLLDNGQRRVWKVK
jgi:hypothetical protein